MPFTHNAYIAGYIGFLELEALAGQPESSQVRNELNRLLALRVSNFTKDSAYAELTNVVQSYCRTLNISSNFTFLTPELAEHLRNNIPSQVEAAIGEYEKLAPYWFVSLATEGYAENAVNPLYDGHSLFMARAWILKELGNELEPYLDVPGFYRGDLFYIQKLVATIENSGFAMTTTPVFQAVGSGGSAVYTLDFSATADFTDTVTISFTNPSPDLAINLSSNTIDPPGQRTLTVTDLHGAGHTDAHWHNIPIMATGGTTTQPETVSLLVNGARLHIPTINKN